MGLRIRTNIPAMVAQRNLASIHRQMAISYRRLATGLRIVTAADDPAGLAMSERLRARIRSLHQAQRNAQDGISLVQVAEGALDEVAGAILRLRELAMQAANGTVSSANRATLQQEFSDLVAEIDRIARVTEFNGIRLLDGSASTVTFQVGAGVASYDQLSVALGAALATTLGLASLDIGPGGLVTSALLAVDQARDSVSALRGRLGASENRLRHAVANLANQSENLSAAESRIRDVDVAVETARLVKLQILQQATVAVLAQANAQPRLALTLIAAATQ